MTVWQLHGSGPAVRRLSAVGLMQIMMQGATLYIPRGGCWLVVCYAQHWLHSRHHTSLPVPSGMHSSNRKKDVCSSSLCAPMLWWCVCDMQKDTVHCMLQLALPLLLLLLQSLQTACESACVWLCRVWGIWCWGRVLCQVGR